MNKTQKIRNELKKLRKKLIAQDENENNALNLARAAMNRKYGSDWRNEPFTGKQSEGQISPSFYEGHTHSEHWMD